MENTMTNFSSQVNILGQLYFEYRDEKTFKAFIEFNDLGLPLAYLTSEGLAIPSEDGKRFIMETFELFMQTVGIPDTGFETLDEVLDAGQELE
jgi:hypothetical protein